MALQATAVCECRSAGSDNNPGYFNPGGSSPGTDWSQQDSAQIVIDGATITGIVQATTTTILIAGATVTSAWNRNGLRITGGTATAGLYEITSVNTGTNIITVDRSAGASTNTVVGNIGGATKFLGNLTNGTGTTLVAGTKIWIKNDGAYSLTTGTAGAGGPSSIGNLGIFIEGYQTTRGDLGSPPVIDAGAQTGITIIETVLTNNIWSIVNVKVDGNNNSTITGFSTGARSATYLCVAYRCTTGFDGAASQKPLNCFASTCTTGFNGGNMIGCVAYSCTTGYSLANSNNSASDSIAYSCSGDGFILSVGCTVDNCVAYGNTGDGFDISAATTENVSNCIAVGNTGYGFNTPSTASALAGCRVIKCATYNNTAGAFNTTPVWAYGNITLTGDPFTNAAGGIFSLNNTAGAGADVRGVALGTYGQTSYGDIGALQHQDSASGGTTVIGPFAWLD